MKERIIIIFVALIAGLFITSAGFLIYQSTKNNTTKETKVKTATNTLPSSSGEVKDENGMFIDISEPKDESITESRSITVKGRTNPDNTIIISTNLLDTIGKADANGNFEIDVDISAGANKVISRSVSPTGDSVEDSRSVTYSTEEF